MPSRAGGTPICIERRMCVRMYEFGRADVLGQLLVPYRLFGSCELAYLITILRYLHKHRIWIQVKRGCNKGDALGK